MAPVSAWPFEFTPLDEIADYYLDVLGEYRAALLKDKSSEEIVSYAYCHSSCWDFAMALILSTGWDGVFLCKANDSSYCHHAAVVSPTGELWDARGLVTLPGLRARYQQPKARVRFAPLCEIEVYMGACDEAYYQEEINRALSALRQLSVFRSCPWAQRGSPVQGSPYFRPGSKEGYLHRRNEQKSSFEIETRRFLK